uniref:ATP-dependent RNA helicase n=1 Tax=Crocodylus porosus TaxID=8502 RepID=A0A7M4EQT5_CROPO
MMKAKKGNKFRASFKSKRRGIKVVGKWKPVEIDPNLFADEQLGDLVCFEELTDYKLISSSKSGKEKGKKRKSDSVSEEEDSTNQKKKRRKGKGLGTRTSKNDHSEERDDTLTDHEDEPKDTVTLTDSEENENKAETASGTEKTLKKKKKKKASAPQQAPPPAKSSKKVTNWTTQVLSGSSDQIADVSAWKDLFVPKPVLQALSSLGFSAPTPIQALALPSAIRDHMDILGAAETGSGKTLAFAIPMIHAVLEWQNSKSLPSRSASADLVCEDGQETNWENDNKMKDPSPEQGEEDSDTNESITTGCMKVLEDIDFDFDNGKHAVDSDKNRPLLGLVLAPTRELAVQVKHHIDAAAKFTGIKTAILVGGMAPQKQQRVLNRKPEIVIATPGRLWELIKEKHPHLSNLRQLRCLVIDEADRMVERGHFLELSQLLEVLSDSHYNPQRQTFVFSATLTLVHQAPTRVLQKKNAKKVDRKTKLEMLIEKVGIKGKPKIIDLTRKEATVETLTETRIHCEKEEKDYYLYYFLLQYPGRTMVFANSIDCIKRLSALLTILDCNPLPLHANMHQKQRLKNLERFAEQESCILLTTDVAARGLDIPNVQHVLHYQERVNLARQIEKMEYYNSRARQHNSWFQQAAEALEIDLDDDVLIGGRSSEQEESKQQKMLKGMKKHLKHLLSQPLFKILMKTKYPTQSGKLLLPWSPVSSSESALSTVSKQQAKRKKKKRLITDELEK